MACGLRSMLTELNWQRLADRRRIARLVMFYKIHYHLVAINMMLESKLCLAPTRTENSLACVILTSFRDYHLYSFYPTTAREWNFLPQDSVLKLSEVHLHLSTWSWALHCHAVNGSRDPSQRSQEVHLYFTSCTRLHHCWLLHYVTMAHFLFLFLPFFPPISRHPIL